VAQTNMAFYPIENQFNSSGFNPAFLFSDSQYTFSIFPIGGMNVGYNNQAVVNQLVSKLLSGINTDNEYLEIVRTMVDHKSYNQKLEVDLLNFTYRSPEGFFNFKVKEDVSFAASIKGPVSGFMILPEVKSVEVGRVQHVPVLILHYREYSLSYSSPSEHQALSWGVRAKLYFGKSVFSSEISGAIKEVAGHHYMNTWGDGKMSLPEEYHQNPDGTVSTVPNLSVKTINEYIFNRSNTGIGVDLGFKYKVNEKLAVSASILDVGNMKWKNNLTSKDFTSSSELDATKISSNQINGVETITKLRDSISFENKFTQIFKTNPKQLAFKTTLPITFYSGISYHLNPRVKLSLADRFIKVKNLNHNTVLASANFDLNNRLTVSTGYSIIGSSYFNLPLAVLYKGDFGQFYIGSDNFFSFLAPSISEFSGITFGTCFYLFRKRDLYGEPDDHSPFHRPKKIKKVMNNGRIQKESTDFGFPEQY
jgi:hypothetical protein